VRLSCERGATKLRETFNNVAINAKDADSLKQELDVSAFVLKKSGKICQDRARLPSFVEQQCKLADAKRQQGVVGGEWLIGFSFNYFYDLTVRRSIIDRLSKLHLRYTLYSNNAVIGGLSSSVLQNLGYTERTWKEVFVKCYADTNAITFKFVLSGRTAIEVVKLGSECVKKFRHVMRGGAEVSIAECCMFYSPNFPFCVVVDSAGLKSSCYSFTRNVRFTIDIEQNEVSSCVAALLQILLLSWYSNLTPVSYDASSRRRDAVLDFAEGSFRNQWKKWKLCVSCGSEFGVKTVCILERKIYYKGRVVDVLISDTYDFVWEKSDIWTDDEVHAVWEKCRKKQVYSMTAWWNVTIVRILIMRIGGRVQQDGVTYADKPPSLFSSSARDSHNMLSKHIVSTTLKRRLRTIFLEREASRWSGHVIPSPDQPIWWSKKWGVVLYIQCTEKDITIKDEEVRLLEICTALAPRVNEVFVHYTTLKTRLFLRYFFCFDTILVGPTLVYYYNLLCGSLEMLQKSGRCNGLKTGLYIRYHTDQSQFQEHYLYTKIRLVTQNRSIQFKQNLLHRWKFFTNMTLGLASCVNVPNIPIVETVVDGVEKNGKWFDYRKDIFLLSDTWKKQSEERLLIPVVRRNLRSYASEVGTRRLEILIKMQFKAEQKIFFLQRSGLSVLLFDLVKKSKQLGVSAELLKQFSRLQGVVDKFYKVHEMSDVVAYRYRSIEPKNWPATPTIKTFLRYIVLSESLLKKFSSPTRFAQMYPSESERVFENCGINTWLRISGFFKIFLFSTILVFVKNGVLRRGTVGTDKVEGELLETVVQKFGKWFMFLIGEVGKRRCNTAHTTKVLRSKNVVVFMSLYSQVFLKLLTIAEAHIRGTISSVW
jgi:hypothetical protein